MVVSPLFFRLVVKPQSPDIVAPEIMGNHRFYPYFKDALGGVDGSLHDAHVGEHDINRYRSRKGRVSQNVMAACRFDLLFCYMLAGWEGSAADGRVFLDARTTDFPVPAGKYYLGDAGFPLCDSCLVPYRGVRYHLKEWEKANCR